MTNASRLAFIDFSRGIVMIIMAWDHLAGFWGKYKGGKMLIGNAPFTETFAWFMSRVVTHVCAPTFIFIAGTVLAISTVRRLGKGQPQSQVTLRIIKRGAILILIQFFIVNGAWDKVGDYYSYLFGVIACIGGCMIILSVLRRFNPAIILGVSLYILLNHQFLDLGWIHDTVWGGHYLRVIIHEPNEVLWYPFTGRYPIIPWLGVMGLGWVFGVYLAQNPGMDYTRLMKPLTATGVSSVVAWLFVRWVNGYGNLRPRLDNSLWEWLWIQKYPPSQGFLLLTLGVMCLLFALGIIVCKRYSTNTGLLGFVMTLGRNALFFYIAHLWLYRFRLPGAPVSEFKLDFIPAVIAWLIGLTILWQLCIRYEHLKKRYPDSVLQHI